MGPQPRTSFGMACHRSRAILFGGVADQAGKGDRVYSENFDELYQFNMEPHLRRWFPVTLRLPKVSPRDDADPPWSFIQKCSSLQTVLAPSSSHYHPI